MSSSESTSFTVEVKHGKEKLEVAVASDEVAVQWLMEALEEKTGVLRKHQKLICKGKVLEAKRSIAEQGAKALKGGKLSVMLMASAGGGGAPPPPPTAGQAALAASRAAKAAKLAESKSATAPGGLADAVSKDAAARERDRAEASARAATSRRAAWSKTGIVGLRSSGIDAVPDEVFAFGEAVRVADFFGNRIAALPPAVANLSAVTRLRLSENRLTTSAVAWEALFSLPNLAVLAMDNNLLTGALPSCVGTALRMEALSLEGNELDSLPREMGQLSRLERLSTARNRLRALPPELGSCARLDTLDARNNLLVEIPAELADAPRLRSLLLDHNRITLAGVPKRLLAESPALAELSVHGNNVGMEELRESDGWETYDARRRARAGKVLESRVLLGDKAFDEGADIERFQHH